jgi:hypothetical protein
LKLKGTYACGQIFAYLSHHDEGTLSFSLLWHASFGHINYDSLCMLKKNGISGLPTIPRNLKQCEACILGEHNKQPFHYSTSRTHRKLELMHSHLCGPMQPILVAYAFVNKHMMTFIDEYTRMCWVYLLKHRSQAFETFKNFIYGFKMEHNLVLVLFILIMEGNALLMNMTLQNRVRSMLFLKNVKLMFWVDAILCVVYVRNISPCHALGNKTPYEMWYNHIPSMWHLRVFGFTCYALIPKEQRNKLGARS